VNAGVFLGVKNIIIVGVVETVRVKMANALYVNKIGLFMLKDVVLLAIDLSINITLL
jgi:hypothetical protein